MASNTGDIETLFFDDCKRVDVALRKIATRKPRTLRIPAFAYCHLGEKMFHFTRCIIAAWNSAVGQGGPSAMAKKPETLFAERSGFFIFRQRRRFHQSNIELPAIAGRKPASTSGAPNFPIQ